MVEDAAWYYPEPKEAAKEIKNYVAFYKGVRKAADEEFLDSKIVFVLIRKMKRQAYLSCLCLLG